MFHAPFHILDFVYSRISRTWLYKGLNDSHTQLNSDLAQLVDLRVMVQRLWVQAPLGTIFDDFFLFFVTLDLSDNLTEMYHSYREKPD